jgi:hypothetical protein
MNSERDDISSVGNEENAGNENDDEYDGNYDFETGQYRDHFRETNEVEVEYENTYFDEEVSSLAVDGYFCPPEFLGVLSPMEFEEIVGMFKQYDTNEDGLIDKHEIRKVLLSLGLDSSLERAEELLNIVDKDSAGELAFSSFCRFIVLIKQGDDKVSRFKALLSKIKDTPLGQLENQAKLMNFKVKFILKSEQDGTSANEKNVVVEVRSLTNFLCNLKMTILSLVAFVWVMARTS